MSHSRRSDSDGIAGRISVKLEFTKPSKTLQQHADACDINAIVARYHRTGALPSARHQPAYGDVTALQGDLTERLNTAETVVKKTQEFFETYDPKRGRSTSPASTSPASTSPS